jgi:hypothetical protein
MAEDRRAHGACDGLDLFLPVLGIGIGDVLLADDAIEDQVEQAVLGSDVPVQGAGGGVEGARDVAHAQLVEAVGVEDLERGVDDRFLGEGVAATTRGTLRRASPRGRRHRGVGRTP